jgi:ABC-type uncharacterized transport system permease subunit
MPLHPIAGRVDFSPQSSFYTGRVRFPNLERIPEHDLSDAHKSGLNTLFLALIAVALFWFVLYRTRWGYGMRAIGGNQQALLLSASSSSRHGRRCVPSLGRCSSAGLLLCNSNFKRAERMSLRSCST